MSWWYIFIGHDVAMHCVLTQRSSRLKTHVHSIRSCGNVKKPATRSYKAYLLQATVAQVAAIGCRCAKCAVISLTSSVGVVLCTVSRPTSTPVTIIFIDRRAAC